MASNPTDKIEELCSECKNLLRIDGFCVSCYYIQLKDKNTKSDTSKHRHILSEIDVENQTATCKECGLVKIVKRSVKSWRCSMPNNERSKLYKKAYRASKRKIMKSYCEICGATEKLCYDHSHKTNKYRGTLCSNCNIAIGFMCDDIDRLKNAIKYLENDDKNSSL